MNDDLSQLAHDLNHAAMVGGPNAGAAAIYAGSMQAEVGLRTPGMGASVAASGTGGLHARIGTTQRRGVYQESSSPLTAEGVNTEAIAATMARIALAQGAAEVSG